LAAFSKKKELGNCKGF